MVNIHLRLGVHREDQRSNQHWHVPTVYRDGKVTYAVTGLETPPSTSDWALVEKCIERMRPLATATEEVEADSATLHTVLR